MVTANARFKDAAARRTRWVAIAVTVGFHLGLLFLTPSWQVFSRGMPNLGPRMVVEIGEWAPPPPFVQEFRASTFQESMREPVWLNPGEANRVVIKHYPPMLWRYREEGSAVFLLQVSRSGRVRHAEILDSSDNATEDALLVIARSMRFELDKTMHDGVVGVLEIAVLKNL